LANLDLRRAGSDAGLCIVRAGRVHTAVIVDRDAAMIAVAADAAEAARIVAAAPMTPRKILFIAYGPSLSLRRYGQLLYVG
jgi:hypothetical protein